MGRQRQNQPERETRVAETRKLESRDYDEREVLADDQESPLYVPRNEWPEGKTLRWIRIEAGNAVDNKNWSQMTRLGWAPVDRELFTHRFPLTPMPGQGDVSDGKVVFGGLCLCARDERLVLKDRANQERATLEANQSINGYVEQGMSDPNFRRFAQAAPIQYERAAFKE